MDFLDCVVEMINASKSNEPNEYVEKLKAENPTRYAEIVIIVNNNEEVFDNAVDKLLQSGEDISSILCLFCQKRLNGECDLARRNANEPNE